MTGAIDRSRSIPARVATLSGVRRTNVLEKFAASVANAVIAFAISLPFGFLWGFGTKWKCSVIATFFSVELVFFLFGQNRDLGMRMVGSSWKGSHSMARHLVYNILYTLSFSTLIFHIWFPFDLFLINMLCVQLPAVRLTGTTLHGYIAGFETVK